MSKILPNIPIVFDLCQLTNTKLKYHPTLHENSISVAKNEAANCSKSEN